MQAAPNNGGSTVSAADNINGAMASYHQANIDKAQRALTPRQQRLANREAFRVNIESFGSSPSIVRRIRDEIIYDARRAGVAVKIESVGGYYLRVVPQ
jgi:hypothetical protein